MLQICKYLRKLVEGEAQASLKIPNFLKFSLCFKEAILVIHFFKLKIYIQNVLWKKAAEFQPE